MNDEYEDDEPSESELNEHEAEKAVLEAPTVSITGLSAEAVRLIVRASVEAIFNEGYRDHVRDLMREKVDKEVKLALQSSLDELAAEALRPRVAEILARGWTETNSYGEPKGQPKTLDAMLRAALFSENSYHNARQGLAVQMFEQALQKELNGELGAALKEAKAKVRGMVDEAVMGKFQLALREGLGLKG